MRGDHSTLIFVLVIGLAIATLMAGYSSKIAAAEKAAKQKLNADLGNLRTELAEFEKLRNREIAEHSQVLARKNFVIEGLNKIFDQRKSQFPWLASALADFSVLAAERDAKHLETKKHPAKKAADEVRENALRRREAEKKLRLKRYRVEYYENLFPWIIDYVGDDVPDYVVDLSGNENDAGGRCNAFASSHDARIQMSRSSSVVRITGMALGWIGRVLRVRLGDEETVVEA